MSNEILTLEETCTMMQESEETIKRYAQENLLTNVGTEDDFKFNKEEVMRYIDFHKNLG